MRTNLARLEAANFGQLIGRGLVAFAPAPRPVFAERIPVALAKADVRHVAGHAVADEPDDSPLAALPVRIVQGKGSARTSGPTALIREALRNHPEGMRLGPLCGATNLDRVNASAALNHMQDVERSGGRRHFLYRLKPTENP